MLEEHLKNSASNALYTSKTVQNELIVICGDIITKSLLKPGRINIFHLLQMRLLMWLLMCSSQFAYVMLKVCHRISSLVFMSVCQVLRVKQFQKISSQTFAVWQLQPPLLRGLAYDGAGAMSGLSKGVAARITSKYPKALYTHWASHCLNLCVVKCCSVKEINSMMQTADSVSQFFSNSPKRQLALEKCIGELLPEEKRSKMKQMCSTR